MLIFAEPTKIYANTSGKRVSFASETAACHSYTTTVLIPSIAAEAYRLVSQYLSQEASQTVSDGDCRQFRTPFDSRVFEVDAARKTTRVKSGENILECYHPIYDRKYYVPDRIAAEIVNLTRRAFGDLKTLCLPPEAIGEYYALAEPLLTKKSWDLSEKIVRLDDYIDGGTLKPDGAAAAADDVRVFVEREALITRLSKYLTLKFQKKIEKVNRIVFFRRARFIREFVPRAVISSGMSGNGFKLNFEDLGTVWRHLAHAQEIRAKAPALLYMYLHHIDRLENFFAFSYTERSHRHYGDRVISDARRMQSALFEQGMAGLRETVFPAPSAATAALLDAEDKSEFAGTAWTVYPFSKRLWRTLAKLPSSRWTEMIFGCSYTNRERFTKILEVLADSPTIPKLSHFKWYVQLIFDSGELSDFEKIWIYRAVLKQPKRLRLNAVQFASELVRVRDFVRFTRPKPDSNQIKAGWTWLTAASDLWHETSMHGDDSASDFSWISPVGVYSAGNYLAIALTSASALRRESNLMHHCVHSYSERARQGKSALFHLIAFPNIKTCEQKRRMLSELTKKNDWQGIFEVFESITTRHQATTELTNLKIAAGDFKRERHTFMTVQIKGFADRSAADFAPFVGALKAHFAAEFNRLKDATGDEAPGFAAQVKNWVDGQQPHYSSTRSSNSDYDEEIPF